MRVSGKRRVGQLCRLWRDDWYRRGASVSELARGRQGHKPGDRGATAVEYALMVGLIAVVIVASVTLFGQSTSKLFLVPTSVFSP